MTTYKKINSKVCIARFYDEFPINYTDWESRAPNWISSAVSKIGAVSMLEQNREEIIVVDYKAKLPSDLVALDAITYSNDSDSTYSETRVSKVSKKNNTNTTDVSDLAQTVPQYNIDNNGYIYTTFEDGVIIVYYRRLPVEKDDNSKLYFPLIEDNEYLIDAVIAYILFMIVQRGHKVGSFALNSPNEFLNPGLMWEKKRKIARNKVRQLDMDDRDELSRMTRTFLVDYDKYKKLEI